MVNIEQLLHHSLLAFLTQVDYIQVISSDTRIKMKAQDVHMILNVPYEREILIVCPVETEPAVVLKHALPQMFSWFYRKFQIQSGRLLLPYN